MSRTQPPLPSLPWYVPFVAGAVWVGLLFANAGLEGTDSYWARFFSGMAGDIAGVAFAVAGIAALAERWQRRQWVHRTQFIAFDLLGEAMDALGRLAATAFDVLQAALEERDRSNAPALWAAFTLPVEEAQRRTFHDFSGQAGALSLGLSSPEALAKADLTVEPARLEQGAGINVEARLDELRPTIEARAARTSELVSDVSGYSDHHAEALLGASLALRKSIRRMVEAPHDESWEGAHIASSIGVWIQASLNDAFSLADELTAVWRDLRAKTDRKLPRYLRASRESQDALKQTLDRSQLVWADELAKMTEQNARLLAENRAAVENADRELE